jgi:LPXTG-motif cell wall-anchored protein
VSKLTLLALLSMLGVLIFAPASSALAQQPDSVPPGYEGGTGADEPCPLDIDQFPEGTVCGEGGGYLVPVTATATSTATFTGTPTATATAASSATASTSATALPSTGGASSSLVAIGALVLLGGSAVMTAVIVRRN